MLHRLLREQQAEARPLSAPCGGRPLLFTRRRSSGRPASAPLYRLVREDAGSQTTSPTGERREGSSSRRLEPCPTPVGVWCRMAVRAEGGTFSPQPAREVAGTAAAPPASQGLPLTSPPPPARPRPEPSFLVAREDLLAKLKACRTELRELEALTRMSSPPPPPPPAPPPPPPQESLAPLTSPSSSPGSSFVSDGPPQPTSEQQRMREGPSALQQKRSRQGSAAALFWRELLRNEEPGRHRQVGLLEKERRNDVLEELFAHLASEGAPAVSWSKVSRAAVKSGFASAATGFVRDYISEQPVEVQQAWRTGGCPPEGFVALFQELSQADSPAAFDGKLKALKSSVEAEAGKGCNTQGRVARVLAAVSHVPPSLLRQLSEEVSLPSCGGSAKRLAHSAASACGNDDSIGFELLLGRIIESSSRVKPLSVPRVVLTKKPGPPTVVLISSEASFAVVPPPKPRPHPPLVLGHPEALHHALRCVTSSPQGRHVFYLPDPLPPTAPSFFHSLLTYCRCLRTSASPPDFQVFLVYLGSEACTSGAMPAGLEALDTPLVLKYEAGGKGRRRFPFAATSS